jgi:hypothetical protein
METHTKPEFRVLREALWALKELGKPPGPLEHGGGRLPPQTVGVAGARPLERDAPLRSWRGGTVAS